MRFIYESSDNLRGMFLKDYSLVENNTLSKNNSLGKNGIISFSHVIMII